MAKKKPGKYAHILPGLPDLPIDAGRQQEIDALKAALREEGCTSPRNLVKRYTELRHQSDALHDQLQAVNRTIEALTEIVHESQLRQEEGWGAYGADSNAFLLANGDRIRIDMEPYSSIEDQEAVLQWAAKEGLQRYLMFHWQALNRIAKDALLAGQPTPPGVKIFKKKKIVYTPMKEAKREDEQIAEWSPDEPATVDQPF